MSLLAPTLQAFLSELSDYVDLGLRLGNVGGERATGFA